MRKLPKLITLSIALLFCVALGVKGYVLQVSSGTWAPQGTLSQPRSGASIALLTDGRLVVTGGDGPAGTLASAEIIGLDGASSTVTSMGIPRSRHISVVLSNGSVLVAGGTTSGGGATNAAEIYDPVADSWSTLAGGMIEARSNATSVRLQDGRVLIAGGEKFGVASSTMEIFDPATLTFSFAGALTSPRTEHAMTLLADGRVTIFGGSSGTTAVNATDIYDPITGNLSAGPVMSTPRSGQSATVMLDGRVLIAGGNNGSTDLTSAEIFDPTTNTIAPVASPLSTPRQGHLAFLLPNNNTVLIVGGTSAGVPLTSAEVFTPWLETFAPTGSLSSARSMSVGSAMKQDGLLLVAGGQDVSGVAEANKDFYGFATVKTDAADYPPGSTVTITGSGWQPGETVTLTLLEFPLLDTHGPFAVVADANGSISDSSFITDEHDLNISFLVTASGAVSQAQSTFKDSKPNTVTVGAQNPDPIAPGASAQYTVTVNFNGNGSSCTSPLSIQNPAVLPTGATATFSPTSLTSTGGNATSTLTITTTNSTPPTATPISFTVLAANGGGTCQSGTAAGSGALTVVENTATTLTSSVNPSGFGQSTTLTATVAKTSGPTTPSAGTVTFKDGATSLGTGTLNASGVATLGVSSLTAGSHNLTASYAGTAIFGASTSNTVTQTVNQASTTTTLVSSVNPSTSGQSVTFTATVAAVAPGSGTATGTVTFKDGAATIGTGTLAGNTATVPTSALAVGAHSITATYNGDTNFTGSTSSALSQTVNQASTTTTITAHTPSPSVVGQAVNITFTVTGGSGTPTGNVTISDGAGDSCAAAVAVGNCSITFPVSGTKSLSAVYAGDASFTGSTSSNVSHTVNAAATTTTITAHTPNPSVVGQPITVNYAVTVNSPGSGTIPGTDNVTVSDGTGDSCTATAATGTCQLTPTTSGAKTLTATFTTGDTNFATSTSAGVSHTINKRATTTNVSLSLTTVVVGQASNATVAVTDADSGTQTVPTGVVTLSSSDTGDAFGTCTLAPSGANAATCTASVTPSKVGASPHTVTATFLPDATHATNNGTASLTVNKASTSTTISSNTPNPSTVGQAITVNFAVTVNSPGAGTLAGNVTVSDGAGNACSAAVAAGSCQVTIGTAGAKTLTATYPGDANFLTSASAGTSQTVNPKLAISSNAFATLTGICSSQITLQTQNADGSASNQGAARTITLSSSSANGKFFSDPGCSTQVSSVPIAAGLSTANFFYNDTSIGSPVITVASTGLASATQTEGETGLRFSNGAFTSPIGQCNAAMTLQSANAQAGGPTSLTQATTISLTSSSAGGKFYSDATCATQITGVVIGPGFDAGHDSPNFFYKDAAAGSPLVTASAGTASATQTETITKVTPVFTVPVSQSITFGTASITLSGTLAAGALFPPSGETVSITINSAATSATIGANGAFSATVNTSAIPASATAYVIAYSYPGDSNFNAATNNATTLTVNKAATTTGFVSSLNPSFSGQQVTFTATVTVPAGVPTGAVQFQDGGANLGSAVTLTNVGGVFSAQLQTSGLAVGTHSVTAVYGGDTNFSASTSSALTQIVKSAVTITSISAPAITFGADGLVTVTVAAQDSSAGTPSGSVTLSVDGGTALSQSLVSGSTTFTVSNLNAGDHPLSAGYAAQNNFNSSSATGNLHVNQAVATLSFGTLTFTYDGSLKPITVTTSPANLTGVAILYSGGATAPTNAGSTPVSATLTNSNYTATPINGTEIINQAPATLAFGTLTFTYDGLPKPVSVTTIPPGLGVVSITYDASTAPPTNAGSYALSASLSSANYTATPITGTETIQAAPVVITVSDPMPTYDGNAHQATISVVPLVSVAVTYNGLATLPISAGTYAVSVTTTDANYAGMGIGTLTIKQAQPVVAWSNPADITFGTALSGVQLNATASIGAASIAGTFTYTPSAGTVLDAGDAQTLTADFTPTDAIDYVAVSGTHVLINVKAKALYVISSDGSRAFGQSNPMLTPAFIGLTNGDTPSSVGTVTCQSAAGTTTAAGTFAATCLGVSSANYSAHYIAGTLSIHNPLSTITEIKGASSNSETLTLGQSDLLTATGRFTDASTRALSVAGGSSYARMPLPTPVSGAAIAEAGGVLYAIGGLDGANTLATIQAYDPKNDNWTALANNVSLTAPRTNAAVVSIAGKIYVIGGKDAGGQALGSIEVLDTTGTNPVVAAYPSSLSTARSASGAAAFNQKLYVVGGSDNSNTALSSVEIFDLVTGAVSTDDEGTALAQASAAVVNKNNISKLYVAGVSGSSVVVVQFDGASWSSPINTALDASQGVGATPFGELLYLLNGADVWSYDGTSFTKKNSLGNSHSATQPVSIGSLIYVASAGSGSTNSNLDAFAPDEVKWTSADATKATVDQSGNIATIAITSPTVTITVASLADPNISANFLLTIIKKTQTIQFAAPSPKTYGDADFSVSATSVDSTVTPTGLLVGFTAGSGDSCTVGSSTLTAGVSSATVHITGAGNCTITAAQLGDPTTWLPATSVPQTFAIAKANAVIVVTPYSVTYDGDAHAATGTSTGVQNDSLAGLNLSGTTHTSAGDYPSDAWTFTDVTGNYNNASGTTHDVIAKANAVVVVTPYSVTYDGDPHTAMGTAKGAKGETLAGMNLSGSTHTNAGDYASDPWTFTDVSGNYNNASGITHDVIAKANAVVVVTPYSVTYDGDPHTATGTAKGVKSETLAGLNLSATTHTNAGDYAVDPWTFTDVSGNYNNTNSTVHDAIAKANPVIVVTPYDVTYDGDPHTAMGTAKGVKGETLAGLNLSGTTHTNAGDYASDPWTFTDVSGNYNNANSTVHDAIAKANPVIVVTPYDVTYDGDPHTPTGTAKGVKGETLAGLNLSATTHTNAGDYASDPWTFTDVTGNYNYANSTVHDTIAKADPVVTATGGTFIYDGNSHAGSGTATGVQGESLTPVNVAYKDSLNMLLATAPVNAGSYSVAARFAGNSNYNQKQGASQPLVINKAKAAISVTPYSVTYDGAAHTAAGSAHGVESPTPVDLTNLLHLSGTTHTGAGDYNADAWTFDGNNNYSVDSGTVADSIAKASSVTAVVCPASVTYDGTPQTPCTASVTGANALNQVLAVSYAGNTNAGTATASATYPGDANHNGSDDTKNFTIAKASSVTAVVCPASVTYDGTPQTPCTASATGANALNQALTVSYASNTNAGTATASATYPGDANHNGSNNTKNFTIAKANAVISVTPYSAIYNGLAHTATGTAKGAMNESLSGLDLSSTSHTNAGDYPVDAWTFTDVTGNYNNANSTVHDVIAKADQTAVTVTGPSDVTYGSTGTAAASGGSGGGGYSFSTGSSTGCSVSGTVVSVINASGTCALTAIRSGDANYNNSASSAPFTVILHKANQATVTVTAPTNVTYGNTGTAAASGGSGTGAYNFDAGSSTGCLLSGPTVSVTNASGTCALTAIKAGDSNYNASASSAPLTVTLNKAVQTITWSTPANIVLGTPLGSTQLNATVTVVGPAPAGTLTYSPAASTVLGAGAHQPLNVTAAATNNYNAASATVYINVLYSTGLCLGDAGHQVLQPINADGTSVFKMGSTVPTKFRVCNASGVSIGTPGIVTGYGLVAASNSPTITVDEDIYSTTPDTAFRWDSTGQQWIFNQSTKNNPSLNKTGVIYIFTINLNDGSSIYFQYGLK